MEHPCSPPVFAASKFPNSTISAAGFTGEGKVASLRTQVSRTTRKVEFGPPQRQCAALALDELDSFSLRHRLARVGAMRARQFGRQPEANQISADNGFRKHGWKLTPPFAPNKTVLSSGDRAPRDEGQLVQGEN